MCAAASGFIWMLGMQTQGLPLRGKRYTVPAVHTPSPTVKTAAALPEPRPVQLPITEQHPHTPHTKVTKDGGHLLDLLQG